MGSSDWLVLIGLLAASSACAGEQADDVADSPPVEPTPCVLQAPDGPFDAATEPTGSAPTDADLPSNEGASITLMTPGPDYAWAPRVGLVETSDGSLLLHGMARSPRAHPGVLNVLVLVDYEAADDAEVIFRSPSRDEILGRSGATWARLEGNEDETVAFDIQLPPGSVADGSYREVQTAVWFDRGAMDTRRWIVYSGPKPPAAVECENGRVPLADAPERTRLDADGHIAIRAPRAATLAVVPVGAKGHGTARFVRIDGRGLGWEGKLGPEVEVAAVWEGALAGPETGWISSFWSARRPEPASEDHDP